MTAHGSALVLGRMGLLLRGPSGSGKSVLLLHLLEEARRLGTHAMLVADDRVHLDAHCGRLLARPPAVLAGQVELRGAGILPQPCQGEAVMDCVADLVGSEAFSRLPEAFPDRVTLKGIVLPRLSVPARNVVHAALLIGRALERLDAGSPPSPPG